MAKTLNLTTEKPEHPTIVFNDGTKCDMRTLGEFSLDELDKLESLNTDQATLEDLRGIMPLILVKPTKKQIGSTSIDHLRRIIDFFLQTMTPESPAKSPSRQVKRRGSTAARSENG